MTLHLFALLTLLSAAPGDSLWVRASFHRVYQENLNREEAHGTLYVRPGERFVLEITRPVHQILTFRAETLLLYYPEDSVAFKIKSSTRFLPLGTQAVNFDDQRLRDLGFVFLNRRRQGDTLWTFWAHPEQKVRATVRKVKGQLSKLEMRDDQNHLLMSLVAREYQQLGDRWAVPRWVKTLEALPDGFSEEIIRLDSLRLTSRVPDWVREFRVPPGIPVKVKGWEE